MFFVIVDFESQVFHEILCTRDVKLVARRRHGGRRESTLSNLFCSFFNIIYEIEADLCVEVLGHLIFMNFVIVLEMLGFCKNAIFHFFLMLVVI